MISELRSGRLSAFVMEVFGRHKKYVRSTSKGGKNRSIRG